MLDNPKHKAHNCTIPMQTEGYNSMENTRTQKGLTSTARYDLIIDTREDRTVYEIWTEGYGNIELKITVNHPRKYMDTIVDPYLGYETTNIQNTELAAAFAETFLLATEHFKTIERAYEGSKA